MENHHFPRCCICLENYSDIYIPKNLPCGHTLCSICIQQLGSVHLRCPECRRTYPSHPKQKTDEFPTNYPLLNFFKAIALENADHTQFALSQLPLRYPSIREQSAGTCMSHGSPLFFMCLKCDVWACGECVDADHVDPPLGKCFIMSVSKAICKIKRSYVKNLGKQIVETEKIQFQLQAHSSLLNDCSVNLHAIENQRKEIESHLSKLKDWKNDLIQAKENVSNIESPDELCTLRQQLTTLLLSFEEFRAKKTHIYLLRKDHLPIAKVKEIQT